MHRYLIKLIFLNFIVSCPFFLSIQSNAKTQNTALLDLAVTESVERYEKNKIIIETKGQYAFLNALQLDSNVRDYLLYKNAFKSSQRDLVKAKAQGRKITLNSSASDKVFLTMWILEDNKVLLENSSGKQAVWNISPNIAKNDKALTEFLEIDSSAEVQDLFRDYNLIPEAYAGWGGTIATIAIVAAVIGLVYMIYKQVKKETTKAAKEGQKSIKDITNDTRKEIKKTGKELRKSIKGVNDDAKKITNKTMKVLDDSQDAIKAAKKEIEESGSGNSASEVIQDSKLLQLSH